MGTCVHLHIPVLACDWYELHMSIMKTVQTYLEVTKLANKGQFERFTVQTIENFGL